MAKDWAAVELTYAALGIDQEPLAVFKDGRRWARLTSHEVIAARQGLVAGWAAAPPDVGQRAVMLLIGRLVDRYYLKAKDGQAQRVKVMNKGLERSLSGAFGGDWLEFVRYLGEQVHPAEQITTAVERTSLLVSGRSKAAQAAASTGVPVEEIERMLAVYWGGQSDSPVDRRVALIRDWWQAFDELHARQRTGMPSLWGLLGDRWEHVKTSDERGAYTPRGYRLLPDDVNARIREMWATMILPRWPDALVTEIYPQAAYAETLGPAVDFWHGVALTCWFICEGPSSRTDIPGIPGYYDRQVKALSDLGCPVDPGLFTDLQAAEAKLTERPRSPDDTIGNDLGNGISFTVSISYGAAQKDGFGYLRDVVTSYRRRWAEQHLDRYLQLVWERDLRTVGDAYHRRVADKGKGPTAKQFAAIGAPAANRWFGGDLTELASALGLPSGDSPTYERLMPNDRHALSERVRTLIGGERWDDMPDETEREERVRRSARAELAERAPEAVQLWEATHEPPPMKLASWAKYRIESAFGDDTELGWQIYLEALSDALTVMPSSPPAPEARGPSAAAWPEAQVDGPQREASWKPQGEALWNPPNPSSQDPQSPASQPDAPAHARGAVERLRGLLPKFRG